MSNKQIQLVLWFLIGSLLLCGGVYGWQQYQLLQKMKVAFVKAGSKISNLSLTNITLSLQLSFTNASAVDITIKDYNFDVSVNGNSIATVTCPAPFVISANSDSSANLTVSFDPTVVLPDLFSGDTISGLLFDYSKVSIEIKGPVTVSGIGITVSNYQVDETEVLSELVGS